MDALQELSSFLNAFLSGENQHKSLGPLELAPV